MKKLLLTGMMILGAALSGCASGGRYYVAARIGPPPPPRYGVMGMAPGPGYMWIDGYWDLRGSAWVWAPGRWVRPPRPHAVWVPHEWREDHGRYRFYRGHWR